MTVSTTRPQFTELSRTACEALLARKHVARLAYSFHDRVDIEPVHYRYVDGWLYARTSAGAKLDVLRHHPWVAFEVDEIEGTFEWRSVVGHGAFFVFDPKGSQFEARAWQRAIEALRAVVPQTCTHGDPVPFRTTVFGVHVDDLRGRAATMSPARPA